MLDFRWAYANFLPTSPKITTMVIFVTFYYKYEIDFTFKLLPEPSNDDAILEEERILIGNHGFQQAFIPDLPHRCMVAMEVISIFSPTMVDKFHHDFQLLAGGCHWTPLRAMAY